MPRKPREQRTDDGRIVQYNTIKVRLYPNETQAELFEKTFGCCRYIWNQMLSDQQRFYCETDKHFSQRLGRRVREGRLYAGHIKKEDPAGKRTGIWVWNVPGVPAVQVGAAGQGFDRG